MEPHLDSRLRLEELEDHELQYSQTTYNGPDHEPLQLLRLILLHFNNLTQSKMTYPLMNLLKRSPYTIGGATDIVSSGTL